MHHTRFFPARLFLLAVLATGSTACTTTAPMRTAPERALPPELAAEREALRRMEEGSRPMQSTRLLVRRGRVDLVVRDIVAAAFSIDSLVSSLGGEQESSQRSDRTLSMTLRVPGDRLDAAILALANIGRVESTSVSATDVTDQVGDMGARLANLHAVRDRLRQYLERTGSIPDVISVERELVRVQSEIDSLEARLTVLRGQVAMAELSVRAKEEVRLGPLGLLFAGIGNLVQWLFVLPGR